MMLTYMKRGLSLGGAIAMAAILQTAVWAESGVTGTWKTIDDKTGQPKALVQIEERGGKLYGKILQLFNPSRPNPTCDKCQGPRKGKPITGMTILSDLKPASNGEWDKGEILDPQSGNTYRCKLRLIEGGSKLDVRGYIGVSALGRSQIWIRQ